MKQNINCHKYHHLQSYWKDWVLYNFGRYWWWRSNSLNNKYQIYSDSGRYRLLLSNYATFHDTCIMWNQCMRLPIQEKGGHRTLSITRQYIFMYLNVCYTEVLVVWIPPQNMFKMFPHISGLENIAFVKDWYWYTSITIEAILFNLYQWRCSIIHPTNTLVNIWQK